MNQLEIAQLLAMIKLRQSDKHFTADDLNQYYIYERLIDMGYMKYATEDNPYEDDEGVKHYKWGFAFTDKAHKLLRRKANELSMRPLR